MQGIPACNPFANLETTRSIHSPCSRAPTHDGIQHQGLQRNKRHNTSSARQKFASLRTPRRRAIIYAESIAQCKNAISTPLLSLSRAELLCRFSHLMSIMEASQFTLSIELLGPKASLLLELLQPFKLVSFIVALWVLDIIYKCTFHQLASVPGPFLAKFSQSWRNIRYFRGVWHSEVVSLHKEYGSVVRIAPNELSIVDTAALKQLYGHGTKATKERVAPPHQHWTATW